MKLAATLLLLATACAPSSHTAVPVSGKARTTTTVRIPATDPAPRQTTTTTTAPEPEVFAAAATPPTVVHGPSILARIAECESGGSYTARNPTSSASGKYQFLTSTWRAWGDPRWPTAADAPPAVQEAAALRLFNELGTRPWVASRHCWGGA